MTVKELKLWDEFDACCYDESWTQTAMICDAIDRNHWTKGRPKPDAKRYLPKVKKLAKTTNAAVEEIINRFDRQLGFIKPKPENDG